MLASTMAKEYKALFAAINADCIFGFWMGGKYHEPDMASFLSFKHEDAIECYAEQFCNLTDEIYAWAFCLDVAKLICGEEL